ncbi:MAG TPA: copper-binding protein [Buttiauxella sp.]|uniref:copper-binding protein n=1 Tax=Buttiauxella sp. TaxID=1972222 RepID=UPI002B47AD42|nr:copper-binding protein [Buttiauxella sp.]HKM95631.1 copper-binding protein [Buttiauxella sp.]
MSIFSARALSAIALSVLTFITVAHAASHDMSHDMPMPMEQHMAAEIYHGQGVVKKATARSVSIAHKPIAALNWPAMTMTFSLPENATLPVVKAGDTVDFTFSQQAEGYALVSVTPTK